MTWTSRCRRFVVCLLAALTFAGCGSPFSNAEQTTFSAARARWAARPFADYTFETERTCFCAPEEAGPVRIDVRAGRVTAVTRVADGVALTPERFGRWYTVDMLFEQIPNWATADWVADIEVSYAELGYPTRIAVRPKKDVTDAGETYTLRSMAALAP